jgi:hypothetical protein
MTDLPTPMRVSWPTRSSSRRPVVHGRVARRTPTCRRRAGGEAAQRAEGGIHEQRVQRGPLLSPAAKSAAGP